MEKNNQTSKVNELSLKDKGNALYEILYYLLEPGENNSAKNALMKAVCQALGDNIDEIPFFVRNKKEKEDFAYDIHRLYEFLDDLEKSDIKQNELDGLVLSKSEGGA